MDNYTMVASYNYTGAFKGKIYWPNKHRGRCAMLDDVHFLSQGKI